MTSDARPLGWRPRLNATRQPAIYVICPDWNRPSGGIKQLYRHVDILNRNGMRAFILHKQKGFRLDCFSHSAKIAYNADVFDELNPPKETAWRSFSFGFV